MAAEHWLRWYHGTVNDPKWRIIAKRAGHALSRTVTVGHVLSVWAAMLECASQASPRGTLEGWCDEDIAIALDSDEKEVAAIRAAMQGKTLNGAMLTAWNRRQIKREDETAADRKRAQRDRQKGKTHDVTVRDNSKCHAASRSVTTETETETETERSKEPNPDGLGVGLPSDAAGATDLLNGTTDAEPKRKACPITEIVALYHAALPCAPRVEKVTKARAGYLRQRWLQDLPTLEAWRNYFTDVGKSPFLTGKVNGREGKPPFVADLEWLSRPGNFAKVAEGRYHRE